MNWFKWNNSPIIVIGMHRSGTSMFTRVLEKSGVFMGGDLSSNSESYTFTHFNEKLLNHAGGSWDQPLRIHGNRTLTFSIREFFLQFLHYKRKPMNVLRFLTGGKWGWKDPRNTFTAPYWVENYFPKATVIHIYRNGIDVAKSLKIRNEILEGVERISAFENEIECFRLWENYVGEAFALEEKLGRKILHISYEDLLNTRESTIKATESFLDVKNLKHSIDLIANEPIKKAGVDLSDELKKVASDSPLMKKLGYR